MYEYISGKIDELNPNYVVIDNNGIGYFLNITLESYTALQTLKEAKLYVHKVIKTMDNEDVLYGFFTKKERDVFRILIDINKVGPSQARMILSSLSISELKQAVDTEDVKSINKIKGIGPKSAQKIIIDLKDKLDDMDIDIANIEQNTIGLKNKNKEEALSALIMLGYQKNQVDKILDNAIKLNPNLSTEDLIKYALKNA